MSLHPTNTTAFPPTSIPANISIVTGPALMRIILNCWLYGILTFQVYIYRLWYPRDKKAIKCLVYGIFALETLQVALSTYDGFRWFVFGYGNVLNLEEAGALIYEGPILISIIAFVVHAFFCWRIWKLGKTFVLPGSIFIVALTAVAGGLASGIEATQIEDISKDLNKDIVIPPTVWLSASATTDTLIAGIMTYLLLRARTHHRHTDNIISRIIRLIVETGSLSAGLAIITLMLYWTYPGRTYFICGGIALGKVYSNTLLVVFNNRIYLTRNSPAGSTTIGDMGSSNGVTSWEIGFSPGPAGPSTKDRGPTFSKPHEVGSPIATQLGDICVPDRVEISLT